MLMHRLLLQHRPLIRPRLFVGQGGTGSIRAVTQQQQINVMNDFKSGKSNALIATSVAEEGIDVGEVDLIVCFDINTSNPTRFIQRIGRTGRKKEGKVLLLATEGKEHSMLKDVLSERNRLNKSISHKGQFSEAFYKQAPRMVPTEFNPKCLKVFIPPPPPEEKKSNNKPKKGTKGNKFVQICQKKDMRHFLKQKVTNDDEDMAVFVNSHVPKRTTPKENLSSSKCESFIEATLNENSSTTLPISPSLPSKSVTVNIKLLKKMGKFIRNTTTKPTIETIKAIASNKLSKDGLNFLINSNSDILLNCWSSMKELWQKGINENDLPIKGVTTNDRQVARSYNQLISHVGSKEAFAKLIETNTKLPNLTEKYKSVFENVQHGGINTNNFEFLIEKFEKISPDFPCDTFSKHSYVKSMIYDDEIDEIDNASIDLNESSHNYNNDIAYESKYRSQISSNTYNTSTHDSDDDVVFVGTTHQSTPIRSQKKSMFNFSETPIMTSSSKKVSVKQSHEKKRQTNILHFMCSNKVPSVESVLHETTEAHETINTEKVVRIQNKSPGEDHKTTADFFEDQFDALIAANSGIIESIENKNKANFTSKLEDPNKSTPNITTASAISSSGLCTKNQDLKISNDIHPELVDIDFNDMSDLSFDENDDNVKNDSIAPTTFPYRSSPDIFDELCDTNLNSKPEAKENSPIKSVSAEPRAVLSPCIVSKKALTWKEIREKYIKPIASESDKLQVTTNPTPNHTSIKSPLHISNTELNQTARNDLQNDSPIHVTAKIRSKRRIIVSDSGSSDDEESSQIRKKAKPLVQRKQGSASISSNKYGNFRQKPSNEFFDDEAKLSGSASEDECEHTIGHYIQDSVVVNDDEVENESCIPMTGIYLQSIRSPRENIRGGFKIPQPRQYNDASQIYSQKLSPDNGTYVADSFVVISDEELDFEKSMCPLERAEEILKMKRRKKHKTMQNHTMKEGPQTMKKKRILRIHNSSEDDDFA